MSVTLITPTGNRPGAFSLCEYFVSRQTRQFDEWIVVDDCDPPTRCTMNQTVIRPQPRWQPGQNTQARNLLAALPHVHGDWIYIIEDDDYYAPEYLAQFEPYEKEHHIIGEVPAWYYNLKEGRFRNNLNYNHASLCQTGFSRLLLPIVQVCCECAEKFIDMELWASMACYADKNKCALVSFPFVRCVGMKGLPGRPGIGIGHRPTDEWEKDDARQSMLYRLLGSDVSLYHNATLPIRI